MGRHDEIRAAVETVAPGAAIREIAPLGGGMSSEMFRVTLGDRRWVARFPGPEVRAILEDPAVHELRVLEAVCAAGLPAPRPVALGACPEGRFLLLEYLEGAATAAPSDPAGFVRQMAETLARIHAIDVGKFDFLPETRRRYAPRPGPMNAALREPEVVEALLAEGELPPWEVVLLHGDFWPGNVLWRKGRLTGIVDWENALRGPALADLAISRLDVCWVLGREAMEAFTARYLELRPIDTGLLRYWDLRAALRPMRDLEAWVGPYAALGRTDVTVGHVAGVLAEWIAANLER